MSTTLNLEQEQKSMSMEIPDDLGVSTVFRCDSCDAQAFAAASKDDMLLLFCGHHAKRHTSALDSQGWELHDKTHLINEQPSVSANA